MPQAGIPEDWENKFAQILDQVAKKFANKNAKTFTSALF
jgi:hypothetical protein